MDEIEGIGDKRKRVLYEKFITIDAVSAAGIDELRAVPGMNIRAAQAVYDFSIPTDPQVRLRWPKRGMRFNRNITKRSDRQRRIGEMPITGNKNNMKYKMLILDIDDTLVPRGGGISQKNAAAIQKAREAGVYVTLATGRGYYGSSHVFVNWGLILTLSIMRVR